MGIFKKQKDYDIHCADERLKKLIRDQCKETPEDEIDYEYVARYYIEQGIKYRELLKKILEEGYSKHQSDSSCDIPNYKSFISFEQVMIDNQADFKDKSICVEGYVAYHLWDYKQWGRNNAGVFIYPLPNKTDIEDQINMALIDELYATDSIILVSDTPLPIERGLHIRVHGVPSFYRTPDGSRAGKVHILVQNYEVIVP